MGTRVMQAHGLVKADAYDFSVPHHHRPHRHLASARCGVRLEQGSLHPLRVLWLHGGENWGGTHTGQLQIKA